MKIHSTLINLVVAFVSAIYLSFSYLLLTIFSENKYLTLSLRIFAIYIITCVVLKDSINSGRTIQKQFQKENIDA